MRTTGPSNDQKLVIFESADEIQHLVAIYASMAAVLDLELDSGRVEGNLFCEIVKDRSLLGDVTAWTANSPYGPNLSAPNFFIILLRRSWTLP